MLYPLRKIAYGPVANDSEVGSYYRVIATITPFAVAAVAAIVLGLGISDGDIASAYTDPVSKARAQDESIYVNSSLGMAAGNEWLTPKFLGRLLLYKPPLLIWLSAFSVRCFGVSLAALRLPALIAAVGAMTLMFLWMRRLRASEAGWCCTLLLLANPLWCIFARLCYTDMLFTASVVCALYAVHRDPALACGRSRVIFAVGCAAGILTKNVAGLLPVFVWMLYSVWRGENARLLVGRMVKISLIILLVAGPWHLYQMIVHPQWFWADYVQVQLLGFGLQPPSQSTAEPQLWFYVRRLVMTDPILMAFTALALPALWRDLRVRRSSDAALLACWVIVMGGSLLAFRYRNLPYALSLIPPLAALGALYSPGGSWRVVVLSAALVAKGFFHQAVFGLPVQATGPIPSAAALRAYAELGRPHDLIVVAPDDEFYSATLPLRHVRYAFIDEQGVVVRYAPHLAYLGVTVSVDQFLDWEILQRLHSERLRAWGAGTEPLATAIVARSNNDVGRLATGRPQSDFFLPRNLLTTIPEEALTHEIVPAANGRVFLLARRAWSTEPVRLDAE